MTVLTSGDWEARAGRACEDAGFARGGGVPTASTVPDRGLPPAATAAVARTPPAADVRARRPAVRPPRAAVVGSGVPAITSGVAAVAGAGAATAGARIEPAAAAPATATAGADCGSCVAPPWTSFDLLPPPWTSFGVPAPSWPSPDLPLPPWPSFDLPLPGFDLPRSSGFARLRPGRDRDATAAAAASDAIAETCSAPSCAEATWLAGSSVPVGASVLPPSSVGGEEAVSCEAPVSFGSGAADGGGKGAGRARPGLAVAAVTENEAIAQQLRPSATPRRRGGRVRGLSALVWLTIRLPVLRSPGRARAPHRTSRRSQAFRQARRTRRS